MVINNILAIRVMKLEKMIAKVANIPNILKKRKMDIITALTVKKIIYVMAIISSHVIMVMKLVKMIAKVVK